MLICSVFGIYMGNPFKKLICWNIILTILLTLDVAICVALFFITRTGILGMIQIPVDFAGKLLGITLATCAVDIAYTMFIRLCFRAKYRAEDETREAATMHP